MAHKWWGGFSHIKRQSFHQRKSHVILLRNATIPGEKMAESGGGRNTALPSKTVVVAGKMYIGVGI